MPEEKNRQKIREFTLLLLWLTSWEEDISEERIIRSWKGYDFDVLNELLEGDLISGSYKTKSVCLTEEGVKKAKEIRDKYSQL